MVAIFTGNGLGIERGSGMVLGSRGLLGQAAMGRAGENVFVNAANGNLIVTRGDEFLMGMGPDATVSRTYNSQGAGVDDNGDNWRPGATRRVHGLTGTVGTTGSTITRTDWDGSETVFAWVSGNVYRSTEGAGAYDTLTYDGGANTWAWQDGDSRVTEVYDTPSSGVYRLATQSNTDGKTVTFGYTSGRLTSITTISTPTNALTGSGKEYISLTYDGSGNLTDVVTNYQADTDTAYETVKRVRYTYTSNRLTKVQVDLSPGDGVVADGKVYEINYGYDGSGRVNSISQTDGSSLSVTYDGSGRVSTLVQSVDGTATRTTSFTYNSGSTVITDPFNQTTTMNFDTSGNLTSIVSPPAVSGGSTQTYSFTYNANGDVITVVDPSGKTITYDDTPNTVDSTGYDTNGNRRLERDHAGNTITRTFGSNNELLTETRYTTPDPDGSSSGSPSGALTTNYIYDSELHLRYVVSPEGYVTEHQYDTDGYRTATVEHTGVTYASTMTESALDTWAGAISDKTARKRTDYHYDFRGQLDWSKSYSVSDSSGAGDTSADYTFVHYLYDQAGSLLSRWIDGSSFTETFAPDGLFRVTSATDLSGLNATTTFTYNSTNSVTTVVVGGVLTKTSTYNLAGELISYAESGTDVTTATTAYRYDVLGRLRDVTDPTGARTYFMYDGVGRKVAEIGANGSIIEFVYNADNELIRTVRYKTQLNSTQLSDLDIIDHATSDAGAGNADVIANFRPSADTADIWEWRIYDDAHRLIQTIDGLGAATRFEYDGLSRLVKTTSYATAFNGTSISGFKTTQPTAFTSPGTSASDRITRYFYDDDGRLEYKFDAEGYLTKLIYDAAGQVVETIAYADIGDTSQTTLANIISSVTVSNSTDIHTWSLYDGRGSLRATINGEGDVVRYHYTALGHLDQEIRGQKLSSSELTAGISTRYTLATLPAAAGGTVFNTTAWTRDASGKILTETRTLASGTEIDVYLYDSFGRVVAVTTASGTAAARTRTYRYDARGRLVAELWGEGSAILSPHMGYTYDQTLVGTASAETINGGAGRDFIQGLAGNDTLYGLGGDDRLEGGAGADKLYGGDGNDILVSGLNNDAILSGGAGRDIFVFSSGDGTDTITDFEIGLDLIDLTALGGYTSIAASGTGGVDTTITLLNSGSIILKNVDYTTISATHFLLTAYDGAPIVGTTGTNTLNGTSGRDIIFGLAGNDTLNGLAGDDRIEGGAGIDAINGGDGDDVIISGAGNDVSLTGGDGRDSFVFISGDGADVILDFNAGTDIIDLTAIGGYSSITQQGADVLVTTATGGGTILVKNITTAQLTAAHFLVTSTDVFKAFGNTYTYDTADRLIAKTTSDGAGTTGLKTLYYYNLDGQLAFEINALGEVVEYRYDAFGRRTDVIAYGGYDPANPTVTGRIDSTTLATLSGGLVNSTVTSAVAAIARSSFDSRTQSAYDVGSNVTSVTDAIGRVTTLEYNAFREATAKVDPLSTSASRRTEFTYNVRGLLTRQKVDPSGLSLQTDFAYDAFGNAVSTTDPDGKVRATDYDRAGRTWKVRNPLNAETTYEYDGRSYVVKIKDALDNETVFTRGEFDRVVEMETQEGFKILTTNNAYGQAISIVQGFETTTLRTTTFAYDRDGALRDTTDGTGGVVRQGYDRAGRLAYSVDGRGGKTTYAYDAANRIVTRIIDDGVQNFTTTYEFDAKGQAIKITEGSKVQRVEFDRIGRTTQVTVDPTGLAIVTTFEHDQVDAGGGYAIKVTEAVGATDASSASIARVTLNTYDKADRLVKTQVDPTGLNLATTYTYDKRGNAVARTDATGRISRFAYDDDNRLVWTIDPAGAVSKTTYDAVGRVTLVRAHATLVNSSTLAGWPLQLVEATHLTVGNVPTSGNDQLTRYVYDRDGRLRYSADSLSHPVEYVYDAVGNLVRKVEYAGTITPSTWTVTDVAAAITSGSLAAAAGTRTTRSTYDAAGRQAFSVDATGGVVSFTYDGNGDVSLVKAFSAVYSTSGDLDLATMQAWAATHASDTGNRTSRTVYDGAGRVAFTVDPTGGVAAYSYDALGNVVQTRTFGAFYSGSGTFAHLTDFATTNATGAHINRAAYDSAGRLSYSVDGVGVVTAFTYDARNEVVQARVFATLYATSGALDHGAMATWAGTNAGSSDRINRVVHDIAGRAAFGIDAANAITAYAYDARGRVVKAVRFADLTYSGNGSLSDLQSWATTHASDTDNRLSRTVYDALGQAVYDVNALGYVSERKYDAFGQVTQTIRYAAAYTVSDGVTPESLAHDIGTLPGTAVVTTFAYDATGRLTDITDALGTVTHLVLDALGQATETKVAYGTADEAVTKRVFDGAGRVTSETRGFGTSDAAETLYAYNAFGQAATVTNPRGFTTTFTYDANGQVATQTVQLASGVNAVTTNEYDSFGNLVKVTDPRGYAGYFYYDALDRLSLQVDPEGHGTETAYSIGGEVLTVKRYYNKANNSYSTTVKATFTGHSLDATTTIERDKLDRVTKVTDAELFSGSPVYEQYTLNAFGDRTTVRNRLGWNTTYTYDKLGQVLTQSLPVTTKNGVGSDIDVVNKYEYDARGNRTMSYEAFGAAEVRTTTFQYDKLDRLTHEIGDQVSTLSTANLTTTTNVTPTQIITYDRRGNIIGSTDAAGINTVYYYDDLDRKVAEIDALGTYREWIYDDAGNVEKARVYETAVTQPAIGASKPSPTNPTLYRETRYEYDRNNRLTKTIIEGLYVGEYSGGTFTASSNVTVTVEAVYDAMGNVVEEIDARGNKVVYFFDKNGRETAKVDQENYITTWTRDAEGNVLSERRYATKVTGTVTKDSVVSSILPSQTANDRVTNFTYDRNGRRLTEARTGVTAYSINTTTGLLTTASTTATITYTYDGLGAVLSKAEATGDTSNFTYDKIGRLTKAEGASFTDYASATVRNTTETTYDGLNNVTKTREGKASADTGFDRVTTYVYGAGGRLASVTDGAGNQRTYAYDATGRVVKEGYTRLKSDGTTTLTEARAYRYDILGRLTYDGVASYNGSSWTFGDYTQLDYNVFGEVDQKGANGLWQESFSYDKAGRLVKSNTGDGSIRLHSYDLAGNRTLTVSSTGTNLNTYADVAAAVTALGSGVLGNASLTGVDPQITVYDKRNMATSSRQHYREFTTTTSGSVIRSKTYNAFGEVASETDARGWTTTFSYNTMGRIVQKVSPGVSITAANGTVTSSHTPTETYYYDLGGRLIGSEDANSNLSTRALLAGTGYGGDEGKVVAEFHAGADDNNRYGIFGTQYDALGNARKLTDEIGNIQQRNYDKMGRLTEVIHPTRALYDTTGTATGSSVTLTDYFAYDSLGQRTQRWNSQLTSSVVETTDYDVRGRITKTVDYAGHQTLYAYSWNASLATTGLTTLSGMSAYGGWEKTTTHVSGLTAVEKTDYFGRLVGRTDLGGHVYSMTFNAAGWLTDQTSNAGQDIDYAYFNTGLLKTHVDNVASATATYGYDEDGRRTREIYVIGSTTWQDSTVAYNKAGWMTSYSNSASNISIAWLYDAAGNIRKMAQTGSGAVAQTYWYAFDTMNRMVITKGTFVGSPGSGSITEGTAGTSIAYDAAGRRASISKTRTETIDVNGSEPNGLFDFNFTRVESYAYTEDGHLKTVSVSDQYFDYDDLQVETAATYFAVVDQLDTIGRRTGHYEYRTVTTGGTQLAFTRTASYNAIGLVTSDETRNYIVSAPDPVATTTYTYTQLSTGGGITAGAFLGGVATKTETVNKNINEGGSTDNTPHDTSIVTTFAWWDGAVQSDIVYDRNTNNPNTVLWTTDVTIDVNGRIVLADIDDAYDRTVTYTNDLSGQIVKRQVIQDAQSNPALNPHETHFYFNGRDLGVHGNDGPVAQGYADIIANRGAGGAPTNPLWRYGSSYTWSDFDRSYTHVNDSAPGSAPTMYTAGAGDTLTGLAQAMWGDASLWYLIAEANGLTSSDAIAAGMSLSIPGSPIGVHSRHDTFRPYDASTALGNLQPTLKKPPQQDKGCGMVGIIILAVVAIVVAHYAFQFISQLMTVGANGAGGALGAAGTAGGHAGAAAVSVPGAGNLAGAGLMGAAATGLAAVAAIAAPGLSFTQGVLAGAAAGAASSIASQGVGLAIGAIRKFDWNQVGLSAISAGVGRGLKPFNLLPDSAPRFLQHAARGIAGSVITQGIALTTGLQRKFNWTGVAVAGVVGATSNAVDGLPFPSGTPGFARDLVSGLLSAAAGAATRSLIDGSDFGDNVLAALPDVIGATIGNQVIRGLQAPAQDDAELVNAICPSVDPTPVDPFELLVMGSYARRIMASFDWGNDVENEPAGWEAVPESSATSTDAEPPPRAAYSSPSDSDRPTFVTLPSFDARPRSAPQRTIGAILNENQQWSLAAAMRPDIGINAWTDGGYAPARFEPGLGTATVVDGETYVAPATITLIQRPDWMVRAAYFAKIEAPRAIARTSATVSRALDRTQRSLERTSPVAARVMEVGGTGVGYVLGNFKGAIEFATETATGIVTLPLVLLSLEDQGTRDSIGAGLNDRLFKATHPVGTYNEWAAASAPRLPTKGQSFSDIVSGNIEAGSRATKGTLTVASFALPATGVLIKAGRLSGLGNLTKVGRLGGPGAAGRLSAPLAAERVATAGAPGTRVSINGVQATELTGRLSTARMATLQAEHGTEFAQIYLTGPGRNGGGGTYYLLQGSRGGVDIPIGPNVRFINHSHPEVLNGKLVPLTASDADRNVLRLLQESGSPQRTSQVVPESAAPFNYTKDTYRVR